MKKRNKPALPAPSRGILAAMAREAGISGEGMRLRYLSGHPETVAEVARREREARTKKRKAMKALISAMGG